MDKRQCSPFVASSVAAAFVLLPALAHAETPKTHDGFYLQIAPGLGYVSDSATIKTPIVSLDYKISGIGGSGSLLFGGTLFPGFVLGGGFQGGSFPKPTFEVGGTSSKGTGTLQISTIGPFVDYYLDPRAGLHFQGFLGFGVVSAQSADGRASQNNPSGLALSVGLGHDWFVSDAWSIGVMGRLQYLSAKYEVNSSSDTHSVIVPAVLATFTYH